MSIIKTGLSAIGKLFIVVALAGAFIVGAVSVIYLSLRGDPVKVPEVVGKDFNASENEIAALGLKLKKRATRYSEEKPNTVLEQLPRPGEIVKTGQTISVVVSEANPEGSEAPATVQRETTDDAASDDSTDVTPDKPVKSNKNTNTKKPSQTTRDVISNKSNKNANTTTNANTNGDADSANVKSKTGGENKNAAVPPTNKSAVPNSNRAEPIKTASPKPVAAKTPVTGGETRSRKVQ